MSTVTLTPDLALVLAGRLHAELAAAAEQIATEARAMARREAYDPADTGTHYADEITAEVVETPAGPHGRVAAHKFTSGWIEFGTHPGGGATFVPPKAILRRAAEAAGFRTVVS